MNDTLSLSDYAAILSRRRWTAALTAAGVFGLLAGYAFLSTPVYRASALVVIEKVTDALSQSMAWQPPDEDYLATQAKLIVSESALQAVYEQLDLAKTEQFAGGLPALRKAATVLAVPKTRLVYVHVESPDPALAAAVSNALAENFVKQNLDNQMAMPKDVLHALRTRARGPEARRIYEALPAVINNPVIQGLKSKLLEAEVQLAELRAKYTPEHPEVQAMASKVALMKAAREKELDSVVRSVTTQLSGQLRPNNVRIVDAAKPPSVPARPRKFLALLLGLLSGAGLGVLAALGRESLDQSVRTHSDFEDKLGLPFLGVIPLARLKTADKPYAPMLPGGSSVTGEAFRDLRTMVGIAAGPNAERGLLVTSAVQDEGKSFVAVNLAVSFAQIGQRVLLIDGDLRRPCQSQSKTGLAQYLAGEAEGLAELARKTDVPNLDVLPAGRSAANASELLNTEQLAALLEWAKRRYDRVVVDCPPVFPVGDVLLWGRHVKAAVMVSRCGSTPVPVSQLACDRLRVGGIDILGGVLNGAKLDALTYGYGAYFSTKEKAAG